MSHLSSYPAPYPEAVVLQVDPVLYNLLERFPDAAALSAADPAAVESLLQPLGLHRRRTRSLIAFSSAFLAGSWRMPQELPGVGKYAADAYIVFCEGRPHEVSPQDHALQWYCSWLRTLEVTETQSTAPDSSVCSRMISRSPQMASVPLDEQAMPLFSIPIARR